MARKRMIHVEMFTNENFGTLSDTAKILFVGMISIADDSGRLKASPRYLKAMIFPYGDHEAGDIEAASKEIYDVKIANPYTHEGDRYAVLPKWDGYQKISHRTESKIPAPPEVSGMFAKVPEDVGGAVHSIGLDQSSLGEDSLESKVSPPPITVLDSSKSDEDGISEGEDVMKLAIECVRATGRVLGPQVFYPTIRANLTRLTIDQMRDALAGVPDLSTINSPGPYLKAVFDGHDPNKPKRENDNARIGRGASKVERYDPSAD
jgi:hypothetical protein